MIGSYGESLLATFWMDMAHRKRRLSPSSPSNFLLDKFSMSCAFINLVLINVWSDFFFHNLYLLYWFFLNFSQLSRTIYMLSFYVYSKVNSNAHYIYSISSKSPLNISKEMDVQLFYLIFYIVLHNIAYLRVGCLRFNKTIFIKWGDLQNLFRNEGFIALKEYIFPSSN